MNWKNVLLKISPEEYEIVTMILRNQLNPEVKVLAFGSRATGHKVKPYSDLDLAIQANHILSFSELAKLQEAFSESNLPYRIDIVDFLAVSPEFKKIILSTAQEVKFRKIRS